MALLDGRGLPVTGDAAGTLLALGAWLIAGGILAVIAGRSPGRGATRH